MGSFRFRVRLGLAAIAAAAAIAALATPPEKRLRRELLAAAAYVSCIGLAFSQLVIDA